jgi:hypothetical protein
MAILLLALPNSINVFWTINIFVIGLLTVMAIVGKKKKEST